MAQSSDFRYSAKPEYEPLPSSGNGTPNLSQITLGENILFPQVTEDVLFFFYKDWLCLENANHLISLK